MVRKLQRRMTDLTGYKLTEIQLGIVKVLGESEEPLNFYKISKLSVIDKGEGKQGSISFGALAENLPFLMEEYGLIEVQKTEVARVPGGKIKYYTLTDLGILYYLRGSLMMGYVKKEALSLVESVINKYADRFPIVFGSWSDFEKVGARDFALKTLSVAIFNTLREFPTPKATNEFLTTTFLFPDISDLAQWYLDATTERAIKLGSEWLKIIYNNPKLLKVYQLKLNDKIIEMTLKLEFLKRKAKLPKQSNKRGWEALNLYFKDYHNKMKFTEGRYWLRLMR